MTTMQRRLIAPLIVVLLVVFAIDALPTTGRVHKRLKDAIDPLLDVTGLWQGSWQLYAPNPDRANNRVTAEIFFADGGRLHWSQPDWATMSGWRRFLNFRHMEFMDNVRVDRNKGAWTGLAQYLARTHEEQRGGNARVTKVVLTRAWAYIPTPAPGTVLPARPYLNFDKKFDFFTWEAK
jgi:hypothetical protein